MRGRPSLPFAGPSPGKPGKGSATFTFYSRIWRGCTALDADFGSIFDKRKPQFIHGSALSGSVTNSDRRGKSDSWGFSNPVFFRHFHEIHPGVEPYGLGNGTCVGRPNIMELSQAYGMVYAECTPGGNVQFLPVGEKHARTLTSFTGISLHEEGIPQVLRDSQCPCAVWIAKSAAVPRLSQGSIGMMVGASNGAVSAYSLGEQGAQKFESGEMVARWILCPGVPIVAISVDEQVNEERQRGGRIWAFALNALGELFYLLDFPELVSRQSVSRSATTEEFAEKEEIRAWHTGRTASWRLIRPSLRPDNYQAKSSSGQPEWFSPNVLGLEQLYDTEKTDRQETWLNKTPIEIRSQFSGWEMRRSLLTDFACVDDSGAGEVALIILEGAEGTNSSILRFTRSIEALEVNREADPSVRSEVIEQTLTNSHQTTPSWSFSNTFATQSREHGREKCQTNDVWYRTKYLFPHQGSTHVTASATDDSILAVTTVDEDWKLQAARLTTRHREPRCDETVYDTDQHRLIPGRRARLFAAGTSTGIVFIWDMRASVSARLEIVNDVQPVRIIFTDSPGIASLAMSSLYLVHGGTEGLLQAWDPLASTNEPTRTLSSRRLVNNRRRAVIAAQQASVPPTWAAQNPESLAASAIRLDPDPTILRGVATIESWVKYWSYSSASTAEELTRSQRRKLKRGSTSRNVGGSNEVDSNWPSYSGNTRRSNLKGYVSHELQLRSMDEADRRRELKEGRRFAGRFGTELLGADASEEDMLAYAKMLSQEENERNLRSSAEANVKLHRNAEADDIAAHQAALSEQDAEKWRFASWQKRFEMLPEGGVALLGVPESPGEATTTPTADDHDFKRAMDLSLLDQECEPPSASPSSPETGAVGSSKDAMLASTNVALEDDPDLAEAIALSLTHEQHGSSPELPGLPPSHRSQSKQGNEEEELERAIRLSLADQGSSSPSQGERSHAGEGDFPSLPASSPAAGRSSDKSKGKGRKGAW